MPVIQWNSDGRRRQVVVEAPSVAVIGRDLEGPGTAARKHIPIADKRVSRRHACVSEESGAWLIEDLGSTNGTRVQRRGHVEPIDVQGSFALHSGDVILVGQSALQFVATPPVHLADLTERAARRDPGLTTKQVAIVELLIRLLDAGGDAVVAKVVIAERLGITTKTVDGHLHEAAEAFGIERTAARGGKRWLELARAAREAGFG
jgi:pSer/pThr/pTyr-binding forkhead associated (FHA) protein